MEPKEYRFRIKEIERQVLIAALEPFERTCIHMRDIIDDPNTPQQNKACLPSKEGADMIVEITSTLLERLRRCNRGRPRKPYPHRA